MRPLASWYRLRLLRQILDELVPGVEQFLLVNNVVAVEDGAALVPGQEHGNPLGDAGADQVAGGGAAAVVKEAGGREPDDTAGLVNLIPGETKDLLLAPAPGKPGPRAAIGETLIHEVGHHFGLSEEEIEEIEERYWRGDTLGADEDDK